MTSAAQTTTTNNKGGYRFLRGQGLGSYLLLLLWIARVSGRLEAVTTKKQDLFHLSFHKMQDVTTVVHRSDHRDPENRRGLSFPDFQQISKNDIQLGLNSDKAQRHPTNEEHEGERRVQDACDTQLTAFYGCLPDDTCRGCYQGAIQAADVDSTLCLEYESFLCAIPTTCPCGSGCQAEAEIVFQCAVEGAECIQTVNCEDTVCESETISAANCDSTLDNFCLECVNNEHGALFQTEGSTALCIDIEEAICQALQTCGCDYCSDKVRDWYSCLYSDECPAIECRTPSPTMAPTMSPTDVGPCLVCGKPTLTVDSSKMVIIDGDSRPCGNVQEEYESTPVTAFECNVLIDLVEKSCGCQAILPPTVPPTSLPMQVQEMSSSKSNLTALSALVAIPLLAAIVYLMMRRNKKHDSGDNRKVSRNPDGPDYEFDETPPVTPSRTTPSRRYNGDHSITESSEEDHYMYGRNHGGEVASHNSGGVPPSGNSIQSGSDQSGGTRRSRDPAGVVQYTAPYASRPAPRSATGGEYELQTKDQCRSVPSEQQVPMALVVEDDRASG